MERNKSILKSHCLYQTLNTLCFYRFLLYNLLFYFAGNHFSAYSTFEFYVFYLCKKHFSLGGTPGRVIAALLQRTGGSACINTQLHTVTASSVHRSHIWFFPLSASIPFFACELKAVKAYQRGFFCGDSSITYPYLEREAIPDGMLIAGGIIITGLTVREVVLAAAANLPLACR